MADQTSLPSRPARNPALPIIDLPDGAIQVGWSRERRFLGGDAAAVRACLSLLQQQVPLQHYTTDQRRLLRVLAEAGALLSAGSFVLRSEHGDARRDRLGALVRTLQRPDADDVLRRRCEARVAVVAPPGWEALEEGLAELGVGRAGSTDSASLQVLVGRRSFATISALMRRGVPHLEVAPRTASVRVGPLVVPSRTPCLQCLHLVRSQRDRHYPRVALKLQTWQGLQPDTVLVRQAGLLAARITASWLDASASPDSDAEARGRYWTVSADDPAVTATDVVRHPLCDCWWELLAGAAGEPVPQGQSTA